MKNRDEPATVTEARKHLGYRAQPGRHSAIQLKHFQGMPWNGTFIDRVLHDAGLHEASFISTVNALGYFAQRNRLYQKPKAGDVVFLNFATDPKNTFEQPHVGIVTDASKWKSERRIKTIEGETSPGVPQGSQLPDGVFERNRYRPEIIGFVRPKGRPMHNGTASAKIKISYFSSNPKTRAKATETLQRALARVGFGPFARGKWDGLTKSALGAYSRNRGYVENRGEPEHGPLDYLADETGEFTLD